MSAINCISIVIVPSPLHSSHRPPSALNEKWAGVNPICFALCWSAYNRRISSYALRYVAGLLRDDFPIGFWSTNSIALILDKSPLRPWNAPGASPASPK